MRHSCRNFSGFTKLFLKVLDKFPYSLCCCFCSWICVFERKKNLLQKGSISIKRQSNVDNKKKQWSKLKIHFSLLTKLAEGRMAYILLPLQFTYFIIKYLHNVLVFYLAILWTLPYNSSSLASHQHHSLFSSDILYSNLCKYNERP